MPATNQLTQRDTEKTKATPPVRNRKRKVEVAPDLIRDDSEKAMVTGWRKMQEDMNKNLLLFKITEAKTLRIEWESLSDNTQKAFTEVLNTVKNKGEHGDAETDEECFVFGFSDEEVNLSAMCTVLNGKTAFFYKEV